MTEVQIDTLIDAICANDRGTIAGFIKSEEIKESLLQGVEVDERIIFSDIIPQIEQDGYEYFYSKILEMPSLSVLLGYIQDENNARKCLDDAERLELHSWTKCQLVIATGDKALANEYIENAEQLGIYGDEIIELAKFYSEEKVKEVLKETLERGDINFIRLIETLGEEYIKDCIAGKIEGVELSEQCKLVLIRGLGTDYIKLNSEYIKECVEGKIDGLVLGLFEQVSLIQELDSEYIKKCVEGKVEGVNFFIESYRVDLIKGLGEEYIRDCVEGKVEGVELSEYSRVSLIKELGREYIKQCLEGKINGVKVSEYSIISLIQEMDTEYIRDCIEGKIEGITLSFFDRYQLIKKMGKEYIRDCIEGKVEGIEFSKQDKLSFIQLLDAEDVRAYSEYIRACIEGREHGINVWYDERIKLIKKLGKEYIRDCVDDKIEGLELSEQDKFELIKDLGVEDIESYSEFIKGCIEGKFEGITFSDIDKCRLIALLGEDYIRECIEGNMDGVTLSYEELMQLRVMEVEKGKVTQNLRELHVPKNMTIGMEIENEGAASAFLLEHFSLGDWSAKPDGSLQNGVEIVSPILTSNQGDIQNIYRVTSILTQLGQSVSDRCGGHIHIGADYLTSVQAYANLMEIWCNTEKILYTLCNENGEMPRRGMGKYASPITGKVQRALEKGSLQLDDETDLDKFADELKVLQDSRYSGLNLLNLGTSKNTIEFRLANGTINPELWLDNIDLFGGIVAVSQELTVTEDKHKQELFEKLKENIADEEKVMILLELVGLEPERYIERYRSNVEFMRQPMIENAFSGVTGPTKITAKKIKEMTADVSALSQQDAMQSIVREMEREQAQQRDVEQGIVL